MDIGNRKLREVFDFISTVNQTAYEDLYLLSNQVLGKNPTESRFLARFVADDQASTHSCIKVSGKIISYYLKSAVLFCNYLVQYLLNRSILAGLAGQQRSGEFIIIDSFLLAGNVLKTGEYKDTFFPGLEDALKNAGKEYIYFLQLVDLWKPFIIRRALQVIARQKIPVITEFQLLSSKDHLRLLLFVLAYPWRVLKLARKVRSEQSYMAQLLADELVATLDRVTFTAFSRYLQGLKLARVNTGKLKLISWYENQVIDKNLIKGLRTGSNNLEIVGTQLFNWPETLLNIHIDLRESRFGINPDRMVVNGPYYIPVETGLQYRVGPSLRYGKLFEFEKEQRHPENILFILPYYEEELKNTLTMLTSFDSEKLNKTMVKFHPAIKPDRFLRMLPVGVRVVQEDLYELFRRTKIVVGASSGALVEAVSSAIPVVVIAGKSKSSPNYLSDLGRGVIWESAASGDELNGLLTFFDRKLTENSAEIDEMALKYKKLYFCRPSPENIVSAFGL